MTGRRRRTADESRANILDVAAKRLHEYGLEGLNITGVAEEAGISHATLIHHFGSSGGMRDALADKMTADLIQDLMAAFDAHAVVLCICRDDLRITPAALLPHSQPLASGEAARRPTAAGRVGVRTKEANERWATIMTRGMLCGREPLEL